MQESALRDLVREGEHQHLEFKRKASDVHRIMREVVAFANAGGGILLIGVSDDGTIPGLKYPDDHAYVMNEGFQKYLKPIIQAEQKKIVLRNGRQVLYYAIEEAEAKPIELVNSPQDRYGKVYLRYQDKSMQLHREGRLILKGLNMGISKPVTFGDVEQSLIDYLHQKVSISVEEFAKLFNLDSRDAGNRLVDLAINHIITLYPTDVGERFILGTKYMGVKG